MSLMDPEQLLSRGSESMVVANAGPRTGNRNRHRNGAQTGELHAVDPAGILDGLAAACIPAFCDGLQVELATEGRGGVAVSYPCDVLDDDARPDRIGGAHWNGPRSARPGRIVIAVRTDSVAGQAPIAGTVTCVWDDPERPTDADRVVARLVAEQAVDTIRIGVLTSALHDALVRTANLEEALTTNREIGQAIGVLMATDRLTAEQAFDRLRSVSQHSHRKLREIAAEVVETGALALAPALDSAKVALGLAPDRRTRQHPNRSTPRLHREARRLGKAALNPRAHAVRRRTPDLTVGEG